MTTFAYDAHFITEVSILLLWAAIPAYTYLTFKRSGHSTQMAAAVGGAILLWGIWAFGAVKYETDSFAMGFLPEPALRVLFYLVFVVALTLLFRKRLVGNGLSQHWLIGLQTVRVIGLVFLLEMFRGKLPYQFALPAGLGDFLTAIIAIGVLVRYRGQSIPRSAILLVFVVGMLDFLSAIFFGVTSSDALVQLFAFENPNQVILYPTGLIPLFGVPFAVIFHILSLLELQRVGVSKGSEIEIDQANISLSPTS